MTSLVELKQALKVFYIRYERYVNLGLKFVLALCSLILINSQMDYAKILLSPLLVVPVSLLCALLPVGFTVLADVLFLLMHLYRLSMETMLVAAVLFLLMYLLYYRYSVQDTAVLILMPLMFAIKIPYVVPIVLGLLMTPLSILSMSFGIVVWFFMYYVTRNASALNSAGAGAEETIGRVQSLMDGLLSDHTMLICIVAFAIVLAVVYFVRRLSVDYAWMIAIAAGSVVMLVVLLIGDLIFDTNIRIPFMILATVISALIALAVMFFSFHLDYERVEKVQFEDDEYYYYVKAVPKVVLQEKVETVKSINRAKIDEEDEDRPKRKRSETSKPRREKKRREDDDSGYLTRQREDAMKVDNAGTRRKRRNVSEDDEI